jgi:hypothetical protein
LVFDPLQSVSVAQVLRAFRPEVVVEEPQVPVVELQTHCFCAPFWSETIEQVSPTAVLHIWSLVQKRGQLDAAAQTLPPPKSQQAWPLDVSQSLSLPHGLSHDCEQMPLPLFPPLAPPEVPMTPPEEPTTPPVPPLEEEEQPPNHVRSTVAAIKVANTLRCFIRPSTFEQT